MIRFQPVLVATGHEEEGLLAFAGERLVAVLTRLGPDNEVAPEHWFLEHAFLNVGPPVEYPVFPDLDAAAAWLGRRIVLEP